MKRPRILFAWSILLAGFLTLSSGGSQPGGVGKVELKQDEQDIVDLTNAARKKEGLPPYKVNAILTQVARTYSGTMAKEQKLDHFLDGKVLTRVKKAKYPVYKVGENLGRADPDFTPAQIFDAWMKSEKHRINILFKDYTEIGVGTFTDAKGQVWYTQVFARPQPSS